MDIYDITASALTAQRMRMDAISSNLANVNTTRREDGTIGAYKRKNVVFAPIYNDATSKMASGVRPRGLGNGSLAESISLKPASHGINIDASGHATIHVGIRNDAFGGAGVQVMQISENTSGETQRIQFPGHPEADENGFIEVPSDMRLVYDPAHPDAIPSGEHQGYVIMPNVNVVTEMVDMISATRAYEANVTALQSAKQMQQSALDI